ncbi:hypothetical protein N7540_007177 [Penicillium herquei]|nr:hypothetical protein N7540_007177 [Penicillium herquei]
MLIVLTRLVFQEYRGTAFSYLGKKPAPHAKYKASERPERRSCQPGKLQLWQDSKIRNGETGSKKLFPAKASLKDRGQALNFNLAASDDARIEFLTMRAMTHRAS